LGIHIIGPLATEILAEAAAVLNLKAPSPICEIGSTAIQPYGRAMGDAFASVRGLQIKSRIIWRMRLSILT